jgi:hypothetical protein
MSTVDAVVERVCQKIHQGLFDLGLAEDLTIEPETGPEFQEWCEFLAKSVRDVYAAEATGFQWPMTLPALTE